MYYVVCSVVYLTYRDKRINKGSIECSVCKAHFSMPVGGTEFGFLIIVSTDSASRYICSVD